MKGPGDGGDGRSKTAVRFSPTLRVFSTIRINDRSGHRKSDFMNPRGRGGERSSLPAITLMLLFINLGFFAATVGPDLRLGEGVAENLGLVPATLSAGTRLWTLITHMFLHADVTHIAFNMAALLFLGSSLERRIGSARFACVYLISGVAAALVFVLLNPLSSTPAVGASAAIFGVMGTLTLLYPTSLIFVLFVPVPTLLVSVLYTFAIINIIQTGAAGWVAQEAHLAGLLSGMVLAFELRPGDAVRGLAAFLACLVSMMVAVSLL